MQPKIYSVFDVQAEAFGQPFFMQTDGIALRSFNEAAQNPQTEISKYPDDYVLYNIGTYDDDTGIITPQTPKRLHSASTALKMFRNNQPLPNEGQE